MHFSYLQNYPPLLFLIQETIVLLLSYGQSEKSELKFTRMVLQNIFST
jgi:hypothetical protein